MTTTLAAALVAASCLGAAFAVHRVPALRSFAVLLGLLGALLAAAAATVGFAGRGAVYDVVLAVGACLVAPLALAAYPRSAWHDPATWALGAVGAACTAVLLGTESTDVAESAVLGLALGLLATGWWRVERSRGEDRQLLLWAACVVGLAALGPTVVLFATDGRGLVVVTGVAAAVVAPALAVGARREAADLRSLVVPTVAAALVGAAYVGVLVVAWRLLDAAGTGLTGGGRALVAFLLALAVAPSVRRLRVVVGEVLFGRRPDPLVAATRAAGAIGDAGDDLDAALAAVRDALGLPRLALHVDGEVVADAGDGPGVRTVEVAVGGDPAVVLEVGLRDGDIRLPAADAEVLRVVAPLLAQVVHARGLAAQLHASRGRVITAVEEERRRLRRDLHDGLGPRLAGMAFTTDAARNVLATGTDADGASALLAEVRGHAAAAVEEVRGIVTGLRPPALDELGLAGALRQHAADVRRHDGDLLAVTVTSGDLGTVPAAVEVAAYRIAVEALTNVARHSDAATAHVELARVEEGLELRVTDDDSTPSEHPWRPGVGLTSMAERAEALGGSVTGGPTSAGGRVFARLPL